MAHRLSISGQVAWYFSVVFAIAAVFDHDPLLSVDSEDGLGTIRPASLTFESDFLLGQELEFSDPDNDSKIIGLEKFSSELHEFLSLTGREH